MDLVLILFEGNEIEELIDRAWLTQLEVMLVWPHKSQNRHKALSGVMVPCVLAQHVYYLCLLLCV